jgi:hypothetical protein
MEESPGKCGQSFKIVLKDGWGNRGCIEMMKDEQMRFNLLMVELNKKVYMSKYFTPHEKSIRIGYSTNIMQNGELVEKVLGESDFPNIYTSLREGIVFTTYLNRSIFKENGWELVEQIGDLRKYSKFPFSLDHYKPENLISIYIDIPGEDADFLVKLIKAKCINELRNIEKGLMLIMDEEKKRIVK